MHTANPDQLVPSSSAQALPDAFQNTLAGRTILAIGASLFVALCAHVSVRVPFTPVPFTLSDLAVVLVGLALGPVTAFSALCLYLAEGAVGLPVFNPGGLGGVAQLLGPTGGFLVAYPFAAFVAGASRIRLGRTFSRFAASLIAAAVASALLMTVGVLWLGVLLRLSPVIALERGMLPFLPGQAVKVVAAAGIFSSLQRWRRA